ncbi:hypothetical protein [Salinithrix halophila]|uniref:Uncharacterized protein n=1 Tax=Salinithrix halophila TaxID=1485204 RepID=A0ABV8JD98_9BACL
MFDWTDLGTFFLAFFVVLPLVTLIHGLGHLFFAWLFGAKNARIIVGCGSVLGRLGMVEIRKIYFWYGTCDFEDLPTPRRHKALWIYLGGALFNLLSIVLLNTLIWTGILGTHNAFYQFAYFSFYYAFFALVPIEYPDGEPSDGQAVLDWYRKGKLKRIKS